MKDAFPILWWLAAAAIIALLFLSMGYAVSQAVLLAVLFLPGMLGARYFYPQLTFENRERGVFNAVYLTLAILITEYLAIALGHRASLPEINIPGLLLNPLFILLVLSACILPEMLIERRLEARRPYDRTLRFVSDRRPVALDPAEVLYVESNDSEVWLHTRSGEAYRTKTRISQWEALLDRRFLRIHRSYIVNTECIEEYRPTRVRIGSIEIEISRKYKEQVRVEAIRNARANAATLAGAIGQTVGKCFYIYDSNSNVMPVMYDNAVLMRSAKAYGAAEAAAEEEPLEFKTIRLEYNVQAKFVLE